MNVVFLSPHFPPHYFRFCLNLKAAGANVLGVGDEPYGKLSQEVRTTLTEYYEVDDMHDYDALVRACGFFIHRYGKIDRLDSLNEYWLGTEARLRDDFNIFGVRGFFTSNSSRRLPTNMLPWRSICGRRAGLPPICLTTPVISTFTIPGPNSWFTIKRS